MSSDTELFFDQLSDLATVMREAPALRTWFGELRCRAPHDRAESVQRLVAKMVSHREDAGLVRCIASLADPRIFGAVASVLDEE